MQWLVLVNVNILTLGNHVNYKDAQVLMVWEECTNGQSPLFMMSTVMQKFLKMSTGGTPCTDPLRSAPIMGRVNMIQACAPVTMDGMVLRVSVVSALNMMVGYVICTAHVYPTPLLQVSVGLANVSNPSMEMLASSNAVQLPRLGLLNVMVMDLATVTRVVVRVMMAIVVNSVRAKNALLLLGIFVTIKAHVYEKIKLMITWAPVNVHFHTLAPTALKSIVQHQIAIVILHGMEFTDLRSVMGMEFVIMTLGGVTAMVAMVDLTAPTRRACARCQTRIDSLNGVSAMVKGHAIIRLAFVIATVKNTLAWIVHIDVVQGILRSMEKNVIAMGNVSKHLMTEDNGLESANATVDGQESTAMNCTQLLHKHHPDLLHRTSLLSKKLLMVHLLLLNEDTSSWVQKAFIILYKGKSAATKGKLAATRLPRPWSGVQTIMLVNIQSIITHVCSMLQDVSTQSHILKCLQVNIQG